MGQGASKTSILAGGWGREGGTNAAPSEANWNQCCQLDRRHLCWVQSPDFREPPPRRGRHLLPRGRPPTPTPERGAELPEITELRGSGPGPWGSVNDPTCDQQGGRQE